jgi:hypothetical protein
LLYFVGSYIFCQILMIFTLLFRFLINKELSTVFDGFLQDLFKTIKNN